MVLIMLVLQKNSGQYHGQSSRYLSHALNAIQTACHNTHGAIICGWDYGPTVKIHDWTSWLIIANRNTGRPINQSDLELLMIRQGQCSSGGFN